MVATSADVLSGAARNTANRVTTPASAAGAVNAGEGLDLNPLVVSRAANHCDRRAGIQAARGGGRQFRQDTQVGEALHRRVGDGQLRLARFEAQTVRQSPARAAIFGHDINVVIGLREQGHDRARIQAGNAGGIKKGRLAQG
jgi:hypothetical protein